MSSRDSCKNRRELGTTLAVTSNLRISLRFLSPRWWRRYVLPKRRLLQEPNGVTCQKTAFFNISICTDIPASNCMSYCYYEKWFGNGLIIVHDGIRRTIAIITVSCAICYRALPFVSLPRSLARPDCGTPRGSMSNYHKSQSVEVHELRMCAPIGGCCDSVLASATSRESSESSAEKNAFGTSSTNLLISLIIIINQI
jgi:hypothetical protein